MSSPSGLDTLVYADGGSFLGLLQVMLAAARDYLVNKECLGTGGDSSGSGVGDNSSSGGNTTGTCAPLLGDLVSVG